MEIFEKMYRNIRKMYRNICRWNDRHFPMNETLDEWLNRQY